VFFSLITQASRWAIPIFMSLILGYGYYKKVRVFEVFVEGAQEGFWTAIKLIPYMVGLFIAIGIFRDSGAMEIFTNILSPILVPLGIPAEVVPLFIVRPLSGVASLTMTVDLFHTLGPDSYAGRLASTIQGSTDTTVYILTIYFASIGIKKFRHALTVGLMADIAAFIAAIFITRWFFGSF
jgi:spore maturation protein B